MQIYNFDKNRKNVRKEKDLRLNENRKKIKEQKNDERIIHIDKNDPYELDMETNFFINVENKVLGVKDLNSTLIYKSVVNKHLDDNNYINCEFHNIKFENCTFHGIAFENCFFKNIEFCNCEFYNSYGNISLFKNNCVFEDCIFDNTDLKKVVFDSSRFYKIKFIFTNLNKSIFDKCTLNKILFSDCNLKSMKIVETNINTLEFEDKYLTKVDEKTFIDKMEINKNNIDYENLYKTYKNISAIYESNRLSSYAGEYYYIAKTMEKKGLKGLEKIKSNIFWAICGYGERPTFALITSFEIVLVFAIIYMFCGLCINGSLINYNTNIFSLLETRAVYVDFIRSFYFSLVTFTSVGYGDIFPTGYSVIFSCIEMILGVTMVGVWTATLARKISR